MMELSSIIQVNKGLNPCWALEQQSWASRWWGKEEEKNEKRGEKMDKIVRFCPSHLEIIYHAEGISEEDTEIYQ